MEQNRLRDLIPRLLAVMLVLSFMAMLLTIVIDTARGLPVDPVAVPVLGTLSGALITALAGFWVAQSEPRREPPDQPPQKHQVEPTGDLESDEWNRDHGYLEFRWWGRWKPCLR
jgi:hypothetical protein